MQSVDCKMQNGCAKASRGLPPRLPPNKPLRRCSTVLTRVYAKKAVAESLQGRCRGVASMEEPLQAYTHFCRDPIDPIDLIDRIRGGLKLAKLEPNCRAKSCRDPSPRKGEKKSLPPCQTLIRNELILAKVLATVLARLSQARPLVRWNGAPSVSAFMSTGSFGKSRAEVTFRYF